MFYISDFAIQPYNIPIVNRNAFALIKKNYVQIKKLDYFSIAYAIKPLLYISSIFAMNIISYQNGEINIVGSSTKIYCVVLILLYSTSIVLVRPISKELIGADFPLYVLGTTFSVFQSFEVVFDIFISAFNNSIFYMNLIKMIDHFDSHFGNANSIFSKRRRLSIILMLAPCLVVSISLIFRNIQLFEFLALISLLFVMTQGCICILFLLIIYSFTLQFKTLLLRKASDMTASKKIIFKDDIFAKIINKLLMINDFVYNLPTSNIFRNNYCWFELMQIYDKISDCLYIFNKIYTQQILLMFNTWLLSTVLVICKLISPTLKNSVFIKTDIFYYTFINFRPLLITKLSECIIQERKKSLLILQHILIYHDLNEDYRSQIETMLKLVEARSMKLSAQVCSVNLRLMSMFAGRMISFTVLIIQLFYLHN